MACPLPESPLSLSAKLGRSKVRHGVCVASVLCFDMPLSALIGDISLTPSALGSPVSRSQKQQALDFFSLSSAPLELHLAASARRGACADLPSPCSAMHHASPTV
ncbi:hypothetical protein P3342_003362 [Pyrenophora teres f. teres]|nr:hypothetical protein P3342_003362 [Pyrenophora teres f. teres]